ncbi:acyl-CoA dehydrogenase [Rhodoferax koreense]|uniref:Acyl-CoA dehydrogenase n=1 Tax=Rhodoferax koreensis TaxID=1842727 RepID=A0A1P8JRE1_9BURK|nr:acyl-CoA/acyl-ACP dehydrogenase [Rhodoferax koreense]APW36309.1 acyl-CoA dehydrogenase [Rhodoferax koreense]
MNRTEPWPQIDTLRATLTRMDGEGTPAGQLAELVALGLDHLPLPGSGATLARWQALAAVARHDLSLAKLYEGHTDALAVLQELAAGDAAPDDAIWGTWAAEPPGQRVLIDIDGDGRVALRGHKPWCSGAASVSHGLLTAWLADGSGPQLVAVSMRQGGIEVSAQHWCAVGMADSASLDVRFDKAPARLIGKPGDYLQRPGFWQGGAGIAACWYGGTLTLAEALHQAVAARPEPFRLAALGRIDVGLRATAALLRETAIWIDVHPTEDASTVTLRARQSAESTARLVLDEVGRALGATPFCRDARFARAAADLPVYIRQSHAERDFAALGERLTQRKESPWTL